MKYECHGHIMADGDNYNNAAKRHKSAPDITHIRGVFEALKTHGISYFRDGGDRFGVSYAAKKLAGEYEIDYATPVFIIHREGYYGSMYGYSYGDMNEARELILRAKKLGADFIKTTVSGMLDFSGDGSVTGPSVSADEISEIVKIANGEGLRLMAHCNGAKNIKNALRAGVSSIEHGFWSDDESLYMMREENVFWVPTCAPVQNLIGCGGFNDATLQKILQQHFEMLNKAASLGVSIASGSDCGARLVMHGAGTDDEYRILRGLGIDPLNANRELSKAFRIMN